MEECALCVCVCVFENVTYDKILCVCGRCCQRIQLAGLSDHVSRLLHDSVRERQGLVDGRLRKKRGCISLTNNDHGFFHSQNNFSKRIMERKPCHSFDFFILLTDLLLLLPRGESFFINQYIPSFLFILSDQHFQWER